MRTAKLVVLRTAVVWAALGCSGWAVGPFDAMSTLEQQSDVILVASLQSATVDATGVIRAQIQPIMVLKGQMPTSPTSVEFPPSLLMQQNPEAPWATSPTGRLTGIWFLKQGDNGTYQVVPTGGGKRYTWQHEAFLPLPAGWSPRASATISHNLLAAVVAHYGSLSNPNVLD